MFPDISAPLRTDAEFSAKAREEHHVADPPLSALPVGLVSNFQLDYMDLVCLGVNKKLLLLWMRGFIFFGSEFGSLYGKNNLPYNVHSLMHLSEDASSPASMDYLTISVVFRLIITCIILISLSKALSAHWSSLSIT